MGSHLTVSVENVANVTDHGSANTYVLNTGSALTINSDYIQHNDVLDLHSVLQAAGWNHQLAELSSYIYVIPTGSDTATYKFLNAFNGGTVSSLTLSSHFAAPTLATLLQHSITG